MREKKLTAGDIIINTIWALSVVVFLIAAYAVWKENDLKDKFDDDCRKAGGIPLKSTYHYDPKENKIHYVCLSKSSALDVE